MSITKVGKISSQQRSLKRMGATEILSSTAEKERDGAARVHALISLCTALLCGLCLLLACGSGSNVVSPATRTTKNNIRSSHDGAGCKSNSECPSGQRCGFTAPKNAAHASWRAATDVSTRAVAVGVTGGPSLCSAARAQLPNSHPNSHRRRSVS